MTYNVFSGTLNPTHFTSLCHPKYLMLLHYLAKWGNTKIAFFHSNAVSVHCQNSISRCLISSVFLTHDLYSRRRMTPFL